MEKPLITNDLKTRQGSFGATAKSHTDQNSPEHTHTFTRPRLSKTPTSFPIGPPYYRTCHSTRQIRGSSCLSVLTHLTFFSTCLLVQSPGLSHVLFFNKTAPPSAGLRLSQVIQFLRPTRLLTPVFKIAIRLPACAVFGARCSKQLP